MQRKLYFKILTSVCFSLLGMPMVVSCQDKPKVVAQTSTRANGSTNSNEKVNISPYMINMNREQNANGEPEKIEEPVAEKDDAFPISEPLIKDSGVESLSPAELSIPDDPSNLIPSSTSPSPAVTLSVPPEIQEKPEPVAEPPAKEEKTVEVPKKETPEPVVDTKQQAEYERSVGAATNISKEEFEEDKNAVLAIIAKLDVIMKNQDYKSWLTYVEDQSVKYWSTRSNLQKAENRLPVKGLTLRNLEDYFKYVFIPSRKGRRVDEIRYETEQQVKAVQVNNDNDTVYYYFRKSVNGAWKLHLPPISD